MGAGRKSLFLGQSVSSDFSKNRDSSVLVYLLELDLLEVHY